MTVSVAASGAAAAFCQPQLVNGVWELVQTAPLPTVAIATDYVLDLVETNDGYDNSPHTTNLSVTVEPAGSTTTVPATKGTVSVPPERLVSIDLVPTIASSSSLTTESPYTWAAPFGPTDHVGYGMDWSGVLFDGDLIEDILSITVSPAGAALGIAIDTSAGRGPMIDTGGLVIGLKFRDTGDATASALSGSGIKVGISVKVFTQAGDTLERTGQLVVRQL